MLNKLLFAKKHNKAVPYRREERTGHQEGNWVCTHLSRLFLLPDSSVMRTFLFFCPRRHCEVAAQGAQRLLTAAACRVQPGEVTSAAQSSALACSRQTAIGLSVPAFPCPVNQTSSKEQEKLGWLLSVESALLPAGHWEVDLEILFAEILY